MANFDTSVRDSQGTQVEPIDVKDFDLEAYADYEAQLLESNRKFKEADNGLLVYRRVRANGVFYDKCRIFSPKPFRTALSTWEIPYKKLHQITGTERYNNQK